MKWTEFVEEFGIMVANFICLGDEIHPIENMFTDGYVVTQRYICITNSDNGRESLFGAPFYYQDKWWIYQDYKFYWDQIDCKN